jgi:hypothetical protein
MPPLHSARRLAWIIWLVEAGLGATGVAFLIVNRATLLPHEWLNALTGAAFSLAYASVGALILARRPQHLVGWLFCLLPLPMSLQSLAHEYAIYGYLVARAPLPGLPLAAWLQLWLTYFVFPATIVLPYLFFPTGRLPSPRWRWLVGLILLATLLAWLGALLSPGTLYVYRGDRAMALPVVNPTSWFDRPALIGQALDYSWHVVLAAYAASVLAVIGRYLRARGDERQQLKWFAYLVGLSILVGLLSLVLPNSLNPVLAELSLLTIFVSAPAAAGIAILRYRLYDIDRLISRTLTYALLSAALSLVYFGSVALLQPAFAGQSPLVIVASTLLVAVLFAPLRSRLQAVIDRRFHRRRYDAQRILNTFSAATRSEVDLDRLSRELQAAVHQSVEPAAVSLWLRDRPARQ